MHARLMGTVYLCATLLIGCLPQAGPGESHDEPLEDDRAEGAEEPIQDAHPEDPRDANQRFAQAAVAPICTDNDQPALWIVLAADDMCHADALDNDRLALRVTAHPDLPIPFVPPVEVAVGEGQPIEGAFVDANGDRWPLIGGTVTIERFDPVEGAAGRFDVQGEEGRRLIGAYAAHGCQGLDEPLPRCFPQDLEWPEPQPPEPEPEPEPDPDRPAAGNDVVPCPGSYGVTEWILDPDASSFRLDIINALLAHDLDNGHLLLDMHFDPDPDTLQVVDAIARGGAPSPEVPPIPPMPLLGGPPDFDFVTAGASPMPVWLTAPDYGNAMPLIWDLVGVRLSGRFLPDCAGLEVEFEGAFDGRAYSIPGRPDVDTDGDGQNDGFAVAGLIRATRFQVHAQQPE